MNTSMKIAAEEPADAGGPVCAAAVRRLETMLLVHAYEETLVELQRAGAPGTCTSVGQEACAVGAIDALEPRDRNSHQPSQRRASDRPRCRPRPPDGRGAGPRRRLLRRPQRQPAHLGDGAACEGIFHESLNLAVQWQLPLLFVCENNDWQAFVHRRETMPDNAIADRAAGHGLPVATVDGNDVEAVHAAARGGRGDPPTVNRVSSNSSPTGYAGTSSPTIRAHGIRYGTPR